MKNFWLTLIAFSALVSSWPQESDAFLFGTGSQQEFQHLEVGYKVLRDFFFARNNNNNFNNKNQKAGRGINGGFSCGACTILVSLAEQLTQLNNETAEASLRRMCTFLPTKYQSSCDFLVQALAPIIAEEIVANSSPDTICYKIKICYVDPGKQMCHLFPLPESLNDVKTGWKSQPIESIVPKKYQRYVGESTTSTPWICKIPGVSELCAALDNVYDKLTPFYDFDGDKFSGVEEFRGAIWRGRDCNDFNKDIRPGQF